jgi:hypothetical protein
MYANTLIPTDGSELAGKAVRSGSTINAFEAAHVDDKFANGLLCVVTPQNIP